MPKKSPKKTSKLTLRQINNLLTGVVVLLAAYIALLPFWPAVTWWSKYEAPVIATKPTAPTPAPSAPAAPADKTLIIPALAMQERIYEGPTVGTLSKGIWKLPNTSTPDKGSNTVLAGHRFTYSGAAVFYNLDKVGLNDPIYIYWGNKRYEYLVSNIKTVAPTEISIEAASTKSMLTIYSCTPLWSAKNRLVIQADLKEVL